MFEEILSKKGSTAAISWEVCLPAAETLALLISAYRL